jgi:hypothetical protein
MIGKEKLKSDKCDNGSLMLFTNLLCCRHCRHCFVNDLHILHLNVFVLLCIMLGY